MILRGANGPELIAPTWANGSANRVIRKYIDPGKPWRGGGCGQASSWASVLPKNVEVEHSWFNRFCRNQTRWEKRQDLYLGFVELTACLIIWRTLAPVAPLKTSSG